MSFKSYKFGDFLLHENARQLFYDEKSVDLSSKAYEILLHLIKNRGIIVSKDKLFETVWADSFVEENNLPVHISALRRILGEKRGDSVFIKTIFGRGYSFIAPVVEINSPAVETSGSVQKIAATTKDSFSNTISSIAVLPFDTENDNLDFEYLAGGITQSLIDSLSQLPKLKVMAYSAVKNYRKSNLDLAEIGFQLSVDKILLGTLSEYKDQLDIRVELIDASDKRQLWGMQYNFQIADVFSVREEISLVIAEKLKLQLNRSDKLNLSQHPTNDPEAYQLYLKGKHILDHFQSRGNYQESLSSALVFFQQAIKKDPNYAPAYIGSGRVYFSLFNDSFLTLEEVRRKCQTALQLAFNADENSSDAYTLQGAIEIYLERDWQKGLKTLAQAVKLNPNNARAFHYLSFLYACLGKSEEAVFYQNQALQFDPTSLLLNSGLVNRFYLARNFRQAIVAAEQALELNPHSVAAFSLMALSFAELGMFDESLANSEKAIAVQPLKELYFMKAYICALAGETQISREIVNTVLAEPGSRRYDFTDLAAVYSVLRDKDKTYHYLEKAFTEGSPNLTFMNVDPRFAHSRDDAEYKVFLQKLNLR